MMVFMSLVLILIGQFVIGRQNVKVVVIGQLLLLFSIRLLFVSFI